MLILVDTSTIINIEMDYCCTPVFEGVLSDTAAAEMAPIIAAIADPVRLRILSMLAASPDGQACGCDIETPLGLSQPTVSHHLKILREAGVIEGQREGRWIHYRVVPEMLAEIRDALTPVGLVSV